MIDSLPMPHITAAKPEEQMAQVKDYLFQLKEELEFILTNISVDNLSQDLVSKLNSLGADIEKNNEDKEEQLQQINNKSITVSDVINSSAFQSAIESKLPSFNVNFETGQLEYK